MQLASAPTVRLLQQHDLFLDLGRRPVRARLRCTALLAEPVVAVLLVATRPLVPSRPRDAVVLAELRHRPLPRGQVTHELSPLLHGARLFPWHPRTCKGCARTRVKDLPRLYRGPA